MIADYMSKPLQGRLFILFREVIMGWAHISTLFDIFSPPEERVEKNGGIAGIAVGPKPSKPSKLTYAEVTRVSASVESQDLVIGKGGDPTSDPITSHVNVDIKVK
jgi:hypothetical protein